MARVKDNHRAALAHGVNDGADGVDENGVAVRSATAASFVVSKCYVAMLLEAV